MVDYRDPVETGTRYWASTDRLESGGRARRKPRFIELFRRVLANVWVEPMRLSHEQPAIRCHRLSIAEHMFEHRDRDTIRVRTLKRLVQLLFLMEKQEWSA